MTAFEFDKTPSPGTNRTATPRSCPTCEGNRLVQVGDNEHGAYMRCPDCNAAPTTERAPVAEDAWWKQ